MTRTLLALAEQIALSAVTFGAMLAFAIFGDTEQFAAYALGWSLFQLISGYYRSSVIVPVIYQLASEPEANIDAWFSYSAAFTIVAMSTLGALAFACWAIGNTFWMESFLTSAVLCVGMLPMEFERRRLVSRGAFGKLLIRGAAMLVILAVALVSLSAIGGMVAILGGVVLSIAALTVYRPWGAGKFSVHRMRADFQTIRSVAGRNILFSNLSATVFAIYNHLLPSVIAITSGQAAVAAFSSTRLASQPAWVLVAGLDNKERAEAARSMQMYGKTALRHHARRYVALGMLTAIPAGIVMLLAFNVAGADFLTKNHANEMHVLLWVATTFAVAVAMPLEAINHVAGRNAFVFLSRCMAAVAAITSYFALPITDGALRGIIAYGIGWATAALLNLKAAWE